MLEVSVFFLEPNLKKVQTGAPRQHVKESSFQTALAGCEAPGPPASSKSASGLAPNFLATKPEGVGGNEIHVHPAFF